MTTIEQMLEQLAERGGQIISSARCGSNEIDEAQAEGRMIVTEDGYGFIWRPNEQIEPCIVYPKKMPEYPDCVYLKDGLKITVGRDYSVKGRAWLRIEPQQIIQIPSVKEQE